MTAELIDFSHAVSTASDDLLEISLRRLSISGEFVAGNIPLRLEEGRDRGEARVRVVALITDDEAKALYGGGHCVRLSLGSARHPDRFEAAVMALREAMARLDGARELAA